MIGRSLRKQNRKKTSKLYAFETHFASGQGGKYNKPESFFMGAEGRTSGYDRKSKSKSMTQRIVK
jgi:hypothetical protein